MASQNASDSFRFLPFKEANEDMEYPIHLITDTRRNFQTNKKTASYIISLNTVLGESLRGGTKSF